MGRCTRIASSSRSASVAISPSASARCVHPQRRALTIEAGPSLDALAPFAVGDRWGAPWDTTWFRLTGDVPASWSGRRVEALIDLGFGLDAPGFQCEGLVRDADGRPVQGIHPRRQAVPVTTGPGPVELVVEAASNPWFAQFAPSPLGSPDTAGDAPLYRLRRAELVVVDSDAEALVHDLDVLDGVMRTLPLDDPRRARAPRGHRPGPRPRRPPARRLRRRDRRRPRRAGRPALPRRPVPAPTGSSPPGTPTSTRPGCGR